MLIIQSILEVQSTFMAVVLEETESKAALFEGGTNGRREEGPALFVSGGCCLVIQHCA